MSIFSLRRLIAPWASIALAASCLALGAGRLSGQSLTTGALAATVVDEHGVPLREVTVTVERGAAAFRILTTDRAGIANVPVIAPGQYALLVEQLGFQPVRARGVTVAAGGTTHLTVRLVHKPPPITTVDEQVAVQTITGTAGGRIINGTTLDQFDYRRDVTDVIRDLSELQPAGDGRNGLAAPAFGLPPSFSRLVVDGVEESLIRHPGEAGEPLSAPLFTRDALQQVMVSDVGLDGEWPGALGGIVSAQTTPGSAGQRFHPWATFSSANLGGRSADNPADSNSMSIQAGFTAGGAIKGDTGAWFATANYQQLAQPTAVPFEQGGAPGEPADLAGAIQSAALAHGNQDVGPWVAPTVRTWKGGSGMGRVDWRFGKSTTLAARLGFASWTETNPQLGTDAVNGAGSSLDASDLSTAVLFTTSGDNWTSETRFGLHTAKRDWTGAALPYTGFVGEGVAIGTSATLPGNFNETGIDLSEAVTYHMGPHELKGGATLLHREVTNDWVPGSGGEYEFGNLAEFTAGQGTFYQATRSSAAPSIGILDASLFGQDTWQALRTLQLFGGVRYQTETLPDSIAKANTAWEETSGIRNDIVPSLASGVVGPRVGFLWDAQGTGRTIVRGSAGIIAGEYNANALSEAAQFDGDVTVRRADGALAWPGLGSASTGAVVGPALTLFGADVRLPRAFKGDLSLTQTLDGGTTLTVSGGYHHTDYLLRRDDLNRVEAPLATGSDGREIWGALQQYGGLIAPAVGSNRRFSEFDMVYGLASTGYDNDYEATVSLEHRVARGLTFFASYTYSQTTDNLVGQLSANPADQLSPFPNGLNGVSWDDGKSDLDIPHRVAAMLQYTSGSASPVTFAARYRLRSGLPFTPGFRAGVDANGDGSGNNDPAFIGSAIPGMTQLEAANPCLASQSGQIASRNSCREDPVQALDLHASFGLGRHLALTLDGFNIIGTTNGLMDHAAVLVNPSGTITTDASGHIVLPLIANTNFGQLLSQREEPRMLRVGIRVEN